MPSKRIVSMFVVAVVILLAPVASASSSGMNFIDSTTINKSDAYTNSVTVNPNQTIIASSYSKYIELHDSSTMELIEKFNLGREVYDIEFSPNGNYIAASLTANEAIPDSLVVIDVNSLTIKPEQARANNRPGNVDWSSDGSRIIAPNMNNGAQIYNSTTMAKTISLNGAHTSDVTCVGFSRTNQYYVTGDESGIVQLWDASGDALSFTIDVEEEVVGCDFSALDAKLGISTVTGNIFSYTTGGTLLQSIDLNQNHDLIWSITEDILYVLESDSTPELIALDGSTFAQIHTTKLMHKSLDFSIFEDNGMVDKIYIATDSNHIAIYGTPSYPEGYGVMGSDLDGDKIPDTLDLDDDGDSFQDDWDFNCLNSTVCSRDPDLQTIRSMVVEISGNTLIIEDIYTMSQEDTYTFRNLTRRGIISDQRISYEETNMLENAICNNMDKNDYIQKLRSSIELSIGQVNNGTTQCEILSGLSFTKTFDKEQLKFSFKTTFDVAPNVTIPLEVYLTDQISVVESSITHIVENHPILINQKTLEDESLLTLWWISDDAEQSILNFSAAEKGDSQINSALDMITDNILVIVILSISTILTVWALIRRKNLNSVILNDEDFENDTEEDDDTEQAHEDYEFEEEYTKPEPIVDNNYTNIAVDDEPIHTESIPNEERPTDRRAFTLDDDLTAQDKKEIRRRSGRIQRTTQGPIMTTKRKRLDGKLDIPGEKVIRKKTVKKTTANQGTPVKKVRKVRTTRKED